MTNQKEPFIHHTPRVIFEKIMQFLSPLDVEKARLVSKTFYTRIEGARHLLAPVPVFRLAVAPEKIVVCRTANDVFGKEIFIDENTLEKQINFLKRRILVHCLVLRDTQWDLFNKHIIQADTLSVYSVEEGLSSPQLRSIFDKQRVCKTLDVNVLKDATSFPVTPKFFKSKKFYTLESLHLSGHSKMDDPLCDSVLMTPNLRFICSDFGARPSQCTMRGLVDLIEAWMRNEREFDYMAIRVLGGEDQRSEFLRFFPEITPTKVAWRSDSDENPLIQRVPALAKRNGEKIEISTYIFKHQFLDISIQRLVRIDESDLYHRYSHI